MISIKVKNAGICPKLLLALHYGVKFPPLGAATSEMAGVCPCPGVEDVDFSI